MTTRARLGAPACVLVVAVAASVLTGCRDSLAESGTPTATTGVSPAPPVSASPAPAVSTTSPGTPLPRQVVCARAVAEAVWAPGGLTREKIEEMVRRKITVFQELADSVTDPHLFDVLTGIVRSYVKLQLDRIQEAQLVVELVKAIPGHIEALRRIC